MDITFACKKCDQHMAVDETAVGCSVNCPNCGQELTIPPDTKPPTVTSSPSFTVPPVLSQQATKPPTVTSSPSPKFKKCQIAAFLKFIAIVDFIVGVIGGFIIGQDHIQLGLTFFLYCLVSGIFVLGFAHVLKYLHKIAYHLENIEPYALKYLQKTAHHLENIERKTN